ncbi:MAG TPA: endonuclease MutS2, partial [Clostridia bacterium]|nr:endonuclease MutS2 [Clostridia bacterium]
IREKLNAMVKSPAYVKYLQEPIITIRNGRYVVPVKQEFRLNVPGLIHDQSGSGATLFIEPMPVVELGNDLRRLNSLEEEEIERVLAALTALVEPYADELYESIGILAELDLIFAKAKLGRQMEAVCPKLEEEAETKIIAGRHPLIAAETVVPVDVWLGGGFSTLIITGPNTGGKTVTLKTIGLFSLMAQAGLFVPAAEGTALKAVKHIFADIGDEQSIEQNLSTFSAHMHTLVNILEKADKNSLVLLDELGAGTDPAEGAALAMSILDTLHDRGCLTAATTHYSEIKAFALSHEGMENASMEFDVDRLCPTFRLFIGIPGKSNAFEIASRLGLSKEIIEKARSYLTKEEVQFEDVLGRAKAEQRLAEQEKLSAQALRKEYEQLMSYLGNEKNKFENEKTSLRQKAREEARAIVREAREEMERAVSELRACKEISMREAERAIQKARDTVRKEEAKLLDIPPKKAYAGGELSRVLPGERVHILSLGQNATVLTEADSKGDVQVQTGIIKLTVKLKELRRASEEEGSAKKRVSIKSSPHAAVGLSLDLRGRLIDEALSELDRYLDDAALVGLSQVQLIHGKGTGALRRGIHEHLRHDKRVKQFRLGNYGEGDAGVTVVTLRE